MDLEQFLEARGLWRKYNGYSWLLNQYITPDDMNPIDCAFPWEDTEEGHAFWKAVNNEYNEMMKEII